MFLEERNPHAAGAVFLTWGTKYLRNFRCAILFWIRLRSSGSVTSDQSSPLDWCLDDEEDPCLLEELEDEW